jgi:hypothetical protein
MPGILPRDKTRMGFPIAGILERRRGQDRMDRDQPT